MESAGFTWREMSLLKSPPTFQIRSKQVQEQEQEQEPRSATISGTESEDTIFCFTFGAKPE